MKHSLMVHSRMLSQSADHANGGCLCSDLVDQDLACSILGSLQIACYSRLCRAYSDAKADYMHCETMTNSRIGRSNLWSSVTVHFRLP